MLSRSCGHDSNVREGRELCQWAPWIWAALLLTPPLPCLARIGDDAASNQNDPKVVATTNTLSWASLGLGGGGAMFTPAISPADPNLILLNCDMSGGYRSIDGGKSWELIHYQQLTGSTRVRPVWHPTDPAVAFAASGWGGSLKVTRDRGRTWSHVPEFTGGVSAIGLDPGDPQSLLIADRRGIWRSKDGGSRWQKTAASPGHVLGFHFDQTSPVENRTCIAATERGFVRSDDGGATWAGHRSEDCVGSNPLFLRGIQQGEQYVHPLLFGRKPRGKRPVSSVGSIGPAIEATTWTSAMGNGIDRRTERWDDHPAGPAQYEFVVTADANPDRVYAALSFGGRVFRSDDRGATWRNVLFQDMASPRFNVGPNYLIDERGGGGDNISGMGINPADPDHLIVADWMNCYISKDGGQTWSAAHTRSAEEPGRRGKGMRWIDNGLVVTTVWNYYLDPFEPSRHYIAYTDIGFARSTDSGHTWYWQTGRPFRNTTYELAFDPETPGKIWAAFADLHDIPNNNVISGRHFFASASGGIGIEQRLRSDLEGYLAWPSPQADHVGDRRPEELEARPDAVRVGLW